MDGWAVSRPVVLAEWVRIKTTSPNSDAYRIAARSSGQDAGPPSAWNDLTRGRADAVQRASVARRRQWPSLKLALTENTALTIAKAMKPTKMNTPISTALAITFVNMLS